jgi:hypothetical protein
LLASLQKEVKKEKPENPEKDTSQLEEDSTEGKEDEANEETANEETDSEDEHEGPEEGLEESNSSPVDPGRRKQVTVTGDSNKTASELRIPKKAKTAEEKKKAEQEKGEKGKKDKKAKKDEKDKKAKKDSTRNTGAPPLQCLPVHQLFYNAYVHESMCACKPVCRAGGRGPSDSDLFKCCAKGQPKKKSTQKARITTGPCTGPRLALPSNDIDIDINDIDFND